MEENSKLWIGISIFCLAILWGSIASLIVITNPQKISSTYPGLVRIGPGQAFITDRKSAHINPLTQRVLLAETLNRKLANNAFNNPILSQKLKMTPTELIPDVVKSEDFAEVEELVRRAKTKDIQWNPKAGNWGMFLLENEPPPSNLPIFGTVELPGGKEKSTFLVERNLNLLLNWVRSTRKPSERIKEESTLEFLKEALSKNNCPVRTPEAVELYGLSKALNIYYDKETNLFLSPETKITILTWLEPNSK